MATKVQEVAQAPALYANKDGVIIYYNTKL